MAALTQDRKSDKLGTEDAVFPVLLQPPVEAATSIYGGALVAINAAGNAVPAAALVGQSTLGLKCVGRCEKQALNLSSGGSPGANGNAGSITVSVRQGVFAFNINADSTMDQTSYGKDVYASDDNTVSFSSANGTRPYAGWIMAGPSTEGLTSTQVGVAVGIANPYSSMAGLAQNQFDARAVVTSLQAYTGSGTGVLTETANGAWAAQDGVTNVVGDVVFIQEGTTNLTAAKDAGPWVIQNLGSASTKWVLVRPLWWPHQGGIPQGAIISIGGEGTLNGGSDWKTFAATGKLIGTDAPVFWVREITQTAVLAAGTVTLTNVGVRSLAKSNFQASLNTVGGTLTGTVGYGVLPNVTALVAGAIGTSSVTFKAIASADAVQASDTSTINASIRNW